MNHPLRCSCGKLKGQVSAARDVNRVVCYCKDCQAFAHFLGRGGEILNPKGGTDILQMPPGRVTFTDGIESLACMRLTEKGLLRWYASCCNTPIGNTLDNYKVSFVGLVHTCLHTAEVSLDDSFGPIRGSVNTASAKADGGDAPPASGMAASILRFIAMVVRARIGGSYRNTPFFNVDSGEPVVMPRILSRDERDRLRGVS